MIIFLIILIWLAFGYLSIIMWFNFYNHEAMLDGDDFFIVILLSFILAPFMFLGFGCPSIINWLAKKKIKNPFYKKERK